MKAQMPSGQFYKTICEVYQSEVLKSKKQPHTNINQNKYPNAQGGPNIFQLPGKNVLPLLVSSLRMAIVDF